MLDANISQESIDNICSFCGENHIPGKEIVLNSTNNYWMPDNVVII